MSKVQVLVTTMHQKDESKYFEMKLNTDAVIANQSDFEMEKCSIHNNNKVVFVSTKTRGLSKNRNIALKHIDPSVEYIAFSDDDLVWKEDYEKIILDSFMHHPDVSAMRFNLNCITGRKLSMRRIENYHIATRREVGSWGVCGLVLKTEVIKQYQLTFNERFGSGIANYCGEDTIFLQNLINKGIKIGCVPVDIADIYQDESTWFEGYNEKYFMVAGMVINEIYPILCYILVIRSAFRAARRDNVALSFFEVLKGYYAGIRKNIEERNKLSGV